MNQVALTWRLAEKDLRIEYRSRQAFLTTAFFAFLILVVFIFAFDPGTSATRVASPGILWVALLFPGIIQLNRSFQMEVEEGTIYGLILSPADRGVLFLGKLIANCFFLIVVDLLVLVAFVIFFNFNFSLAVLWIILMIVLADLGFIAVGTVFAAMVSSIRTRDVLLPILLFPMIMPIIIPAVNGTQEMLVGGEAQPTKAWIQLLVVFDVIFVSAGFLLFDHVVSE